MKHQITSKSLARESKKRKHEIKGTVIKVKGRTVGQVINGEYVKDIRNSHMLTTPPAIANDLQALHDAERAGAVYCVFTNTDTGIIYRAAIAKIWDMGKPFNFGWGDQIMLTLPNWTQTRGPDEPYNTQTQTPPPDYSDPNGIDSVMPLHYVSHAPVGVKYEPGAKQMTLWGEK